MFACQFGRYRYKWLWFGAAPAGDMYERKIDEIFKDMPNVFGIADDILVAGYEADGIDQCKTVKEQYLVVLHQCKDINIGWSFVTSL